MFLTAYLGFWWKTGWQSGLRIPDGVVAGEMQVRTGLAPGRGAPKKHAEVKLSMQNDYFETEKWPRNVFMSPRLPDECIAFLTGHNAPFLEFPDLWQSFNYCDIKLFSLTLSASSSSARPCTRGPASIARKRRREIGTPASPHLKVSVGHPFLPLGGSMKDQKLDGVH